MGALELLKVWTRPLRAWILRQKIIVLKILVRMYQRTDLQIGVRMGRYNSLLPPNYLHSVGDGDFVAVGESFVRQFVDIGHLKPHHAVLDIGSGTGRVARPLTKYLTTGTYDGIDIVCDSVTWCQRAYARRHPLFHFHFADIRNQTYNPHGKYDASSYSFPFADSSFDFICLTSVFTHMLPGDMERYFGEITRLLKLGGHCFITCFLLNEESQSLIQGPSTKIPFPFVFEGFRTLRADTQEDAVAYDECKMLDLFQRHQLLVEHPIRYGGWCGREKSYDFQDIIIAEKTVE